MMGPSPELSRLLASEIARRVPLLADPNVSELEVRAALHALKGSAAMAGQTELALVIGQHGHALRGRDPAAVAETRRLLEHVLSRLTRDLPPFASVWPEPPQFLVPSVIDPRYRAEYFSAIRNRLAALDIVLGNHEGALEGLESAQRNVHAVKGAAAALGDDVTAWYCHGLEAALRVVPREPTSA